ncbi:MAG: hypothetical protein ACYCU0_04165 [Solirubrobacteraceae bacterium]
MIQPTCSWSQNARNDSVGFRPRDRGLPIPDQLLRAHTQPAEIPRQSPEESGTSLETTSVPANAYDQHDRLATTHPRRA